MNIPSTTRLKIALLALLLTMAMAIEATAQLASTGLAPDVGGTRTVDVKSDAPDPFRVGEQLDYSITLGRMRLGTATMTVEEKEPMGGVLAYRTSLHVDIGAAILRYEDRLVSWIEPVPLRSRAFMRRDAGSEKRFRHHAFDPEGRRVTVELRSPDGRVLAELGETGPIATNALDELAALYFLRSMSLADGETRTLHRYFDPAADLMQVTRLGTRRIRVPAGRFEAVVYRVVIPALPAFQADRDARIYLSDDDQRLIVQIETDLKIGRLVMYLTDHGILDGHAESP